MAEAGLVCRWRLLIDQRVNFGFEAGEHRLVDCAGYAAVSIATETSQLFDAQRCYYDRRSGDPRE